VRRSLLQPQRPQCRDRRSCTSSPTDHDRRYRCVCIGTDIVVGVSDGSWTSDACSCTPDCTGKQCGDDGCNGSCGVCNDAVEKFCEADQRCTDACTPRCDGRTCGDDGCGGTCGTCG